MRFNMKLDNMKDGWRCILSTAECTSPVVVAAVDSMDSGRVWARVWYINATLTWAEVWSGDIHMPYACKYCKYVTNTCEILWAFLHISYQVPEFDKLAHTYEKLIAPHGHMPQHQKQPHTRNLWEVYGFSWIFKKNHHQLTNDSQCL